MLFFLQDDGELIRKGKGKDGAGNDGLSPESPTKEKVVNSTPLRFGWIQGVLVGIIIIFDKLK